MCEALTSSPWFPPRMACHTGKLTSSSFFFFFYFKILVIWNSWETAWSCNMVTVVLGVSCCRLPMVSVKGWKARAPPLYQQLARSLPPKCGRKSSRLVHGMPPTWLGDQPKSAPSTTAFAPIEHRKRGFGH